MKKLLMASVMIFVFAGVVSAAPFLMSNPQDGVIGYTITGDAYFVNPIAAQADGSLKTDLADVPNGTHSLTVAACNLWGCGATVPFVFIKTVPTATAGLKVVAK
jgi:hypothetical protein